MGMIYIDRWADKQNEIHRGIGEHETVVANDCVSITDFFCLTDKSQDQCKNARNDKVIPTQSSFTLFCFYLVKLPPRLRTRARPRVDRAPPCDRNRDQHLAPMSFFLEFGNTASLSSLRLGSTFWGKEEVRAADMSMRWRAMDGLINTRAHTVRG